MQRILANTYPCGTFSIADEAASAKLETLPHHCVFAIVDATDLAKSVPCGHVAMVESKTIEYVFEAGAEAGVDMSNEEDATHLVAMGFDACGASTALSGG